MAGESRERRLTATFISLADTLVDDYDVVDLLQKLVDTCRDLLDAAAAGLLLADDSGELALVASTSENSRLVELMQLESGSGPGLQAFETGQLVQAGDIEHDDRWPQFRAAALEQGFHSVHAVPLKLRNKVIGALNLFALAPGLLSENDTAVAQGLADIATIGILHERTLRENDLAREQLQNALNSRVVIEQAKGVIAQLHGVDMEAAFNTLRGYSRNHGIPLRDVADLVVKRKLAL
ncbi:GAF and ANTAR domain-containing protein [soil metagenome]